MSTSQTNAENDSGPDSQPAPTGAIRRRAALIVALVMWSLGIVAGSWYGMRYETTAAETALACDRWPANDVCALSSQCPTLVMFAHPRCPCTRASLSELELLMTHRQGRVAAHVIFFQPRSSEADWAKTDLWKSAAAIPGVTTHLDVDGTVQERFAGRVSGETFLYEPSGKLAFHGGITASRGHAGDNDGRSALETLLINRKCPVATTPVFGCALIPAGVASKKCDTASETRPVQ